VVPITPVSGDILRVCDFDGAYEDRAKLKLSYWPSDGQSDMWLVSDNEKLVDISFGRTILLNWRRLLIEMPEERSLGLGEDHVVFVW